MQMDSASSAPLAEHNTLGEMHIQGGVRMMAHIHVKQLQMNETPMEKKSAVSAAHCSYHCPVLITCILLRGQCK